jgi:hypothetical protein
VFDSNKEVTSSCSAIFETKKQPGKRARENQEKLTSFQQKIRIPKGGWKGTEGSHCATTSSEQRLTDVDKR